MAELDTLLTPEEMQTAVLENQLVPMGRAIAEAQDRKTKRGLVEWLMSECSNNKHEAHWYPRRRDCHYCWKELINGV